MTVFNPAKCDICGEPIGDEPHDGLALMKTGNHRHWRCTPDRIERTEAFKQDQARSASIRENSAKRRQEATEAARRMDNQRELHNGQETMPLVIYDREATMGRTSEMVVCPFCFTHTLTYRWSRCGGGKRCQCGAMLGSNLAYRPVAQGSDHASR